MSCLKECESLLKFHAEITNQFPKTSPHFETWVKKLNEIRNRSNIESLESESDLNKLSLLFRQLCLNIANHHTSKYLKSPPHYQPVKAMSGDKFTFPYDRWGKPFHFEKRYTNQQPLLSNWSQRHYFFTNAMAAVSTLLIHFKNFMPNKKLSILGHDSYFEFFTLLKLMSSSDISARLSIKEEKFYTHIENGTGNLIFIEPVFANSSLTVFDSERFTKAWKNRPNKDSTLILIDTTLVGDRFDMKSFTETLEPHPPALLLCVTSALKLHQIGLEMANLAIVSSYISKKSKYYEDRKHIRKSLCLCRQTMGTGATFEQYSSIDFPMLSKQALFTQHCEQVFSNNAFVARELADISGLIKQVIHPTLSKKQSSPWAVSPYIIFTLKEGTKKDLRFLRRVLENQANRLGISFHSGSSFGFRFHRFEVNDYHNEKELSFRIAMGACNGPSVIEIIKLIKKMSTFENFHNMRRAFPKIPHPDDT